VRAFVRFQVASSIALLTLVTACFIVGAESPLNPSMVLLANVLIDGPPAQTLGLEPVPPESVHHPLRLEDEQILTPRLLARTLATGTIMAGTLLASFWHRLADGAITARDSTLVFAAFVVLDMASAYAARCGDRSIFSVNPFSNVAFSIAVACVLVFLVLSVHVPLLQLMLSTEALTLYDWGSILLQALGVLIADEILKPCLASPALGMSEATSYATPAEAGPADGVDPEAGADSESDESQDEGASGSGEGAAMLASAGQSARVTRRRPQ
jgi:Ca2+-transporting ATPase